MTAKEQKLSFYYRNKEKILAQQKIYRKSHPPTEERKKQMREYARKHKKQAYKNMRKWYLNYTEKHKAYTKKWRINNRMRVNELQRKNYWKNKH